MNQRFGKEYKLCSRKQIDSLFSEGEAIKSYPFMLRYQYAELNTSKSFQVVISAPKRNFKKAVDRNHIKRLMREALRKNKSEIESLLGTKNQQLALFLMFTARDMPTYQEVENKMMKLLNKLEEVISKEI